MIFALMLQVSSLAIMYTSTTEYTTNLATITAVPVNLGKLVPMSIVKENRNHVTARSHAPRSTLRPESVISLTQPARISISTITPYVNQPILEHTDVSNDRMWIHRTGSNAERERVTLAPSDDPDTTSKMNNSEPNTEKIIDDSSSIGSSQNNDSRNSDSFQVITREQQSGTNDNSGSTKISRESRGGDGIPDTSIGLTKTLPPSNESRKRFTLDLYPNSVVKWAIILSVVGCVVVGVVVVNFETIRSRIA